MGLSWDLYWLGLVFVRGSSEVKNERIATYIMRKDFEFLFKATDARIEECNFFRTPKFCFKLAAKHLPKGWSERRGLHK